MKRIPPGEVCYRCGKKAILKERDSKEIKTGNLICKDCYNVKYTYGTYEIPEKRKKPAKICYICGKVAKHKERDHKGIETGKRICSHHYNLMRIYGIYEEHKREKKPVEFCHICAKEAEYKERDINGFIIGPICKTHYMKNDYHKRPDTNHNIIKSMSDRRTGNLEDPRQILGDNCEEATKEWLGAERLATKYDKFAGLPLDHGPISKHISVMIGDKLVDLHGKVPQTKGSHYSSTYGGWSFKGEDIFKGFDILILYCINKDGKIIERIYIYKRYNKSYNISQTKIDIKKYYQSWHII